MIGKIGIYLEYTVKVKLIDHRNVVEGSSMVGVPLVKAKLICKESNLDH